MLSSTGCVTRASYPASYTIEANTVEFRDDETGERMGVAFPADLTVDFEVRCTWTGRAVVDKYGQITLVQSAMVTQDVAILDTNLFLVAKEKCDG